MRVCACVRVFVCACVCCVCCVRCVRCVVCGGCGVWGCGVWVCARTHARVCIRVVIVYVREQCCHMDSECVVCLVHVCYMILHVIIFGYIIKPHI